jgi:hypothetical protein
MTSTPARVIYPELPDPMTPGVVEVPFCPLLPIIPERATPELLALEAKLAAQMSYRQVVNTMREFLPVRDTRRRRGSLSGYLSVDEGKPEGCKDWG